MVSEDEVNQLLAALSPEEFERIWPHLSELDIPVGHVLFNPGDIIRDVYFPSTAIISMTSRTGISHGFICRAATARQMSRSVSIPASRPRQSTMGTHPQ